MGPQHPALPRTFPRHEEDQNFGGSGSERPDQHLNVLQPVRDNVAFSGSHQPEASLDLVPRHGSALGSLRTGSMCGLNVARSSAARLRCSRSSAPIAAAPAGEEDGRVVHAGVVNDVGGATARRGDGHVSHETQ